MRKCFDGDYKLTQGFGENPADYAKFGLKGHNGVDFGCPVGTSILAPIAGKVIEATNDSTGYGYYVKIENEKEGCVIAHFSKITVTVGFILKEGDPIGLSGGAKGSVGSGNSTGPHVHLGYYLFPRDRTNGYGGFIDPLPYFKTINTDPAYVEALEKDKISLWQQRDEILKSLAEMTVQYNQLNNTYTAIAALGVVNVDDLQKERKNYENQVIGLTTEISQVRDRCAILADQISKMDKEESAALDEATGAIKERNQLRSDLAEVKKTVGASVQLDFQKFLEHLQTIIEITRDYFAKQKKPSDFQPGTLAPIISAKNNNTFWSDFLKATGIGTILGVIIFMVVYFGRW